jgi:hypothetical protein
VRRSDEVEAQRSRWTFYETITLWPFEKRKVVKAKWFQGPGAGAARLES